MGIITDQLKGFQAFCKRDTGIPSNLRHDDLASWNAGCNFRQKEIDTLRAQLREQHQNQLDLIEKIQELSSLTQKSLGKH